MELDYDKLCEEKIKENEKYFKIFERELKNEGLSEKVKKRHMDNAYFYVNHFLLTYDILSMEDGLNETMDFFGYYFIRKCLFSNPTTFKEMLASIKKFYKIMYQHNFLDDDNYNQFFYTIKECKDEWLNELIEYNSEEYF